MTTEEATPAPRFSRGKKFSLAGGIGAVALGIGAVVALPMLTGGAAYAVEAKDDGNVYVEIRDPKDADGLEAALAEHGIKSDVTYTPKGKMCEEGRYEPAKIDGSESVALGVGTEGDEDFLGFEVNPDNYRLDGDTSLVIEISEGAFSDLAVEKKLTEEGIKVTMMNIGAAKGEIGECVPVDADDEDAVNLIPDDSDADDEGITEKQDDDGSRDKN